MSNLDLLIEHYEAERDYLESELEACKANAFFSEAQYFFDHLMSTNRHLYNLYCLKDPDHKEKKFLKHQIRYLQRSIEKNPRFNYKQGQLEKVKKTLFDLEKPPVQTPFFEDTDILDEALQYLESDLVLMFVLNKEKDYSWKFERLGPQEILLTCSSNLSEYLDRYNLKNTLPKLKKMGFQKNQTANNWHRAFQSTKPESYQHIKGVLGQFIFEVLSDTSVDEHPFLYWKY